MPTNEPTKSNERTSRRPLYDSAWLALFELLREALSQVDPLTLSRGDSLSHRP
jgi:hypothetical protein